MPTYEYRCSQGHHFELFQRISEPAVDRCPQCGATAERLLSSGAGFIFKGSGFYITDYRSDKYKKAAEKDSGASTNSSDSSSSKPAEKPASGGGTASKD
jgi:putative FmdB family regulatory protein